MQLGTPFFYKTYSGTDTLVFIMLPNTSPIVLGSLTTLSYSTYREKRPVNLLGRINVAGYTRGTRTVAGTMIFTVINQHWVNELKNTITSLKQFDSLKPDELPLFDLMLMSANEYGSVVQGFIYGVDINGDGGVVSVEDIFSENTINYVARDIDLLGSIDSLNENVSFGGSSNSVNIEVGIPDLGSIIVEDEVKLVNKKELEECIGTNTVKMHFNVEDIDIEKVLYQYDPEVLFNFDADDKKIVSVISYYSYNSKSKLYEIEDNVLKVSDIIESFIYDIDEESIPAFVEIIINEYSVVKKIIIKLESGCVNA